MRTLFALPAVAILAGCTSSRIVSKDQLPYATDGALYANVTAGIVGNPSVEKAGYVSIAEMMQATRDQIIQRKVPDASPEHVEAIYAGRVMDGMNYWEVCAAWGAPAAKRGEQSSFGTVHRAWWYYFNEWDASRHVTFINGHVLYWNVQRGADLSQTAAGIR